MSPVNSPASASPSMMAGMNPPPAPDSGAGDTEMSGRIPGAGQPAQTDVGEQKRAADVKLKKDIDTIRSFEAQLVEFGQSYPTAAKALNSAAEAIRAAQRQIVASPGGTEPPKPNTLA